MGVDIQRTINFLYTFNLMHAAGQIERYKSEMEHKITETKRLEKFRCGFCSYTAASGHSKYCTQYRRAVDQGLQDDWDN